MGYISSVGIVVHKDVDIKFKTDVLTYLFTHSITATSLLDVAKREEKEDCVLYYWETVKWYDKYVEVEAIAQALFNLKVNRCSSNKFYFIRVGEGKFDAQEIGKMKDVFNLKESMIY